MQSCVRSMWWPCHPTRDATFQSFQTLDISYAVSVVSSSPVLPLRGKLLSSLFLIHVRQWHISQMLNRSMLPWLCHYNSRLSWCFCVNTSHVKSCTEFVIRIQMEKQEWVEVLWRITCPPWKVVTVVVAVVLHSNVYQSYWPLPCIFLCFPARTHLIENVKLVDANNDQSFVCKLFFIIVLISLSHSLSTVTSNGTLQR